MAQYIDKSALVAEIERRKSQFMSQADNFHSLGMEEKRDHFAILASNMYSILSFINTLEVKKVDFEAEWKKYFEYRGEVATVNVKHLAKHFFELGLKAKNWEKERMEECPYRQIGCTMYEGKILECRGVCSWVVDYPKLKELKAQKGK